MAATSELIDFRRAFLWLLCGMLLPSVALVAFGVVAVANERAAVERRLENEYDARLGVLKDDVDARLQAAATSAARAVDSGGGSGPLAGGGGPLARPDAEADRLAAGRKPGDPLIVSVTSPEARGDPALVEPARRAAALPRNSHLFASSDSGGERKVYAVVHTASDRVIAAQIDLLAVAAEVPRLAAARFPKSERGVFRMLAPAAPPPPLATLRRLLEEVAPPSGRATVVARRPLGPPLDGFTLAAELSGDDPAATLAFRNRTWYIALLVLLYAGIGIGFGLTIREMRRAYKLSRLKTDFVANISHELRTPLTSVRLFAETLRQGRVQGAEQQECLDQLASEAQRLSGMVEKLLDWSRLESGRKMLKREPTDLRGLFDHVQEIFRAQQLGTTYQTELDPGLPEIAVDRDAMAQAVLNLLHNAVKYTGPDKRIRLRGRRGGDGTVAIEVADNGVGIRPYERKRIFERFYRADDLLSRHTEGTGLGLAIAKRIVEAHGGRIEVESQEGKGTTFRIELPPTA
ncbi:MAG: two-component sensor histidine kinase [Deltaproteobacteria bacterium]|nr:MAG: two-component sensor histidine kinase [Deltaproteobacteria bacterium]